MAERYPVDRLWPDPAAGLDLDELMAGFALPEPPKGRPHVGLNMVTSIDGRAQRGGTAEGIGSRVDRRLLRHYRAAYDAVAAGAGTLRRAGLWLRVGDDLAAARAADGRPPQPTGVLVAGTDRIPLDARWFAGDEPRIVVVGRTNATTDVPDGTELVHAPTARPEPAWILDELHRRGMRSVLLEGGPRLNAAFLAAGLVDELYWTIGARLLASDGLPMVAPIPGNPLDADPLPATLAGVLRHEDELFLRYRLGASR